MNRKQVCNPVRGLGSRKEELDELLSADPLALLERVRGGLVSLGRLVGGALGNQRSSRQILVHALEAEAPALHGSVGEALAQQGVISLADVTDIRT